MKLVPSVAYLQIHRQAFVGYSMALGGWIGERLLNQRSLPRPIFFSRALKKLNFKLMGEERDDNEVTQFFTGRNVGVTVSHDPFHDSLFLQIYPLKRRISSAMTIRAQYIEFYDQFVVSIEPAQKLPRGIRSLGINPLILEDDYPLSVPYWGMVHEDWENDLKILVMVDEVFHELREKEYRCPVCFSPLRIEGNALKCDTCGFTFTDELGFQDVLESVEEELAF
ncbi:hypothetical protein [Palaeococcus ferrophilus]|uniref:hypothetical protein n=1 Tax=Palaeococcus ferrophilus TaxID=83868 RepID=UPI00064E6385|nr:hypothetical protein [Palaeococcus ferrophilus]